MNECDEELTREREVAPDGEISGKLWAFAKYHFFKQKKNADGSPLDAVTGAIDGVLLDAEAE